MIMRIWTLCEIYDHTEPIRYVHNRTPASPPPVTSTRRASGERGARGRVSVSAGSSATVRGLQRAIGGGSKELKSERALVRSRGEGKDFSPPYPKIGDILRSTANLFMRSGANET